MSGEPSNSFALSAPIPIVMSPVRQSGLEAGVTRPKMTAAKNPAANALASFTFI
jgi:hypothetical protein